MEAYLPLPFLTVRLSLRALCRSSFREGGGLGSWKCDLSSRISQNSGRREEPDPARQESLLRLEHQEDKQSMALHFSPVQVAAILLDGYFGAVVTPTPMYSRLPCFVKPSSKVVVFYLTTTLLLRFSRIPIFCHVHFLFAQCF